MENEYFSPHPKLNVTAPNDTIFIFDNLNLNSSNYTINNENEQLMAYRLQVASSLCLWCGLIQVIMSILQIGSISKYFSLPLLRGFTTAAAFHVFTTQLQHIFGIYHQARTRRRFFKLFYVSTCNNYISRIKILNF